MAETPSTTEPGAAPAGPHRSGPGRLGAAADPVVAGSIALAVGLTAWLAAQWPAVLEQGALEWVWPWVPSFGVSLAFRLDGLSMLFAMLISTIGVLVLTYAAAYAGDPSKRRRLVGLLAAFMVSMLGLVLADDLIVLFIFWELTTIISYLLIGFQNEQASARKAALQGLLVTAAGGLAMLAGLVMLGLGAGTFRVSEVVAAVPSLPADLTTGALVLLLIGAFTKSAQMPFHFWLPNAMAAPTPASAYLHSATMVKAGIFLLARFHPAFSDHALWFPTLTIVGGITAVWASIQALRQDDMKQMLAHTTVMGLGSLTLFLGSSEPVALAAALTFLVVHALYKCALFLVVGIIDLGTKTRDWRVLGGLAGALPVTAAAAIIAGLSMAGFPPFLGFVGKELKYEGALAIAEEPWLAVIAAVLANAMMVTVAAVIVIKPFLRRPPAEAPAATGRRMSAFLWLPPLIMGACGLVFGLMPTRVGDIAIVPAIADVAGEPVDIYLALWHGINLPLMLSIATVALGILIYLRLDGIRRLLNAIGARLPISASGAYDGLVTAVTSFAAWQTRRVQTGRLSDYAIVVLTVAAAALLWAIFRHGVPGLGSGWGDVQAGEVVALLLIVGGAAVAIAARSRLSSLTALGSVGVGIALVFLQFGAIDVAITQFMVETLVVLLVAAIIPRLPRLDASGRDGVGRLAVRAGVATTLGLATFLVLLGIVSIPVDRTLTAYFELASVPDAHGGNIVNVILVDFRALDTLGEIVVVVIAAMGAWAILRRSRARPRPAQGTAGEKAS